MKRKATISTTQLILIVVIAFIGAVFIFSLIGPAYGEGCKRAQMDELNKIWGELRYWEAREELTSPVSFNIIPDFHVKPCVIGITYEKEGEEENIVVEWSDGLKDYMPAKGKWLLCKPLPPNDDEENPYYKVKVSFRRVEIIGFFDESCECECNEASDGCDVDIIDCIGCALCDKGVCNDGKWKEDANCCFNIDCPDHSCDGTTCRFNRFCDNNRCNWHNSDANCGFTEDECEENCGHTGCRWI